MLHGPWAALVAPLVRWLLSVLIAVAFIVYEAVAWESSSSYMPRRQWWKFAGNACEWIKSWLKPAGRIIEDTIGGWNTREYR